MPALLAPPPPAAFCLVCRALLDDARACDCASVTSIVLLDDRAADRIDEQLLEKPHVDYADLVTRLVVGAIIGPGAVAAIFAVGAIALAVVAPEIVVESWPWVFALPLGVLTVAWAALLISSSLEQIRARYRSVQRPRPLSGESIACVVDRGVAQIEELRPHESPLVVLRDAWIAEPLVLRRPGQRIEITPRRLRVELPASHLTLRRARLDGRWPRLPEGFATAGILYVGSLRRGEEVELVGGTLERIAGREGSFRDTAEELMAWVPSRERTCIRVAKRARST